MGQQLGDPPAQDGAGRARPEARRHDLTVEDDKAILEAPKPEKITLAWIISEMKRLGPENEPELVDWGPDRSGERIDDEYSRGETTLDDILKGR